MEKPERLVEGYVCLSGGYEGLTSVRESLLNTHGKEEEGTQWFAGVESQQRRARVSLPVNQSAIQSVSRSFSQCRFYTPNVFFSLSVYIQSQVPQWWLSRCVLLATNDNPLSVSETRNGNTKKTDRKLGSYWWCCTIFVFHRWRHIRIHTKYTISLAKKAWKENVPPTDTASELNLNFIRDDFLTLAIRWLLVMIVLVRYVHAFTSWASSLKKGGGRREPFPPIQTSILKHLSSCLSSLGPHIVT